MTKEEYLREIQRVEQDLARFEKTNASTSQSPAMAEATLEGINRLRNTLNIYRRAVKKLG